MRGPNMTAFQAMVDEYEIHGWDIRTIDPTTLRATVRTRSAECLEPGDGLSVTVPLHFPTCRRIWVDGAGQVQETNVPC